MHEVGHNLNLYHADEGTVEYGDHTGMIGYSYSLNESPITCFNATKNIHLGWYTYYEQTKENGMAWSGSLVGVSDVASGIVGQHFTSVSIDNYCNSNQDYVVLFNRW